MAFRLVRNAKSADFPQENCKTTLDRLVSNYTPHISSSLLKLKSEFHNSKLKSIEKDPDKWISNLEGLRIEMNEFGLKDNITDKNCMIRTLNNLPEDFNVILNGLKGCLTAIEDDVLTIEIICEKLNHQYEKIKNKNEEKREKEKALRAYNKLDYYTHNLKSQVEKVKQWPWPPQNSLESRSIQKE